MMIDKWINKSELEAIAKICRAMDEAFEVISDSEVSVGNGHFGGGDMMSMEVYDSNGDLLGHIGYADHGFALYLDNGQ